MKRSLCVFLILTSSQLYSQTERGSLMLGGSGSFSKTKNTLEIGGTEVVSTNTSISFYPDIAYFVANRFSVGIKFSLSSSETDTENFDFYTKTNVVGIGPSVRYYILLTEQWALFPTVSYAYQQSVEKTTEFGVGLVTREKQKGSSVKLGGGITYFINKNIGLEGILSYQEATYNEGNTSANNLAFNVGLQIYLAGKKN